MKKKLLISACLYGSCCKYNGGSNALPAELIAVLKEAYELIPVCPEVAGKLTVPRCPAERIGNRVMNSNGDDVTVNYAAGAVIAMTLTERFSCDMALLKARSPSCGNSEVYDGSFSHILVPGHGVTAELLMRRNIKVFNETEIDFLLKGTKEENGYKRNS